MSTPINPTCLCRDHKRWMTYYGSLTVGDETLLAHEENIELTKDPEECVACRGER